MSKPSERIWTVELWLQDRETGEWFPDPNALPKALLELNGILSRIGGFVQIAADRKVLPGLGWQTTGIVIDWRAHIPAPRRDEESEPEPEELPDPPEDEAPTVEEPTAELPAS